MPVTGWVLDWVFLVPKFKVAITFQMVCSVYQLYDIFAVYASGWPLFPYPVVLRLYNDIKDER